MQAHKKVIYIFSLFSQNLIRQSKVSPKQGFDQHSKHFRSIFVVVKIRLKMVSPRSRHHSHTMMVTLRAQTPLTGELDYRNTSSSSVTLATQSAA